jgi:putative two-component system response regulator
VTARKKQLCLLVAAQAVCVAVGLWMQYHARRASVEEAVQGQAWSDIEQAAGVLRKEGETLNRSAHLPDADALEPWRALLDRAAPQGCDVTIVDGRWRTVLDRPAGSPARPPLTPGQPVSWVAVEAERDEPQAISRGTVELQGGPHIAVAVTLGGRGGRLLVHRSLAEIEAAVAPLTRGLLPVNVVALVWTTALLSLSAYLILSRYQEAQDRERARSASEMLRQTQDLIRTRDAVIFALAKLADFRDHETGSHLERISNYVTVLATALRRHAPYARRVTPTFIRLIGLSAVLHDIGKVGTEDRILRKAGKLTPGEREHMEQHTVIAGRCLGEIAQRLGHSDFLQMAREIALSHHERWDGTGYPQRLRGEDIPLSARIVAIADVYDALATVRVYKDARPHEECVAIITAGAGRHFDPELVKVWLTVQAKFGDISARCAGAAPQTGPSRFHADPAGGAAAGDKTAARPATENADWEATVAANTTKGDAP